MGHRPERVEQVTPSRIYRRSCTACKVLQCFYLYTHMELTMQ